VVVVDTGFLMQGVTVDLGNYIPWWLPTEIDACGNADDPQV
jgi:hypothetical protein